MMECVLEYTSLGVEDRIVSQILALRTLYKASFLSLFKRGIISAVNQRLRTPQQCKGVNKTVLDSAASMQGIHPLL